MLKIAAVCLLFVQLVYSDSLPSINDDSHIIDDCSKPGEKPKLLYGQEIRKTAVSLRTQEETIRIPADGFAPKPITCITVINMDADDDAGYPSIKAGGLGSDYVFIHLKSQLSKGFDFLINVYYDLNEAT